MKKVLALLLAILLLAALAACGGDQTEEPTRGGMPQDGEEEEQRPYYDELDLNEWTQEEGYRELTHLNGDPRGYKGMKLRLTGIYSTYTSHGKTFYYVGVPNEDGRPENLELLPAEDGGLPEGFPEPGKTVTVSGVVSYYTVEQDGETIYCAVLEDARLS